MGKKETDRAVVLDWSLIGPFESPGRDWFGKWRKFYVMCEQYVEKYPYTAERTRTS